MARERRFREPIHDAPFKDKRLAITTIAQIQRNGAKVTLSFQGTGISQSVSH
jgi:hypothetical protein